MKLEIGAGDTRRNGFMALDVDPKKHPDIVAEAGAIPLDTDAVEELVAINVLEHVEWHDVRRILAEWGRVVKEGGTLEIHVPDIEFVAVFLRDASPNWNDPAVIQKQPYNAAEDRWEYLNHFVMSTDDPHNMHRSVFNFKMLSMLLKEIGCVSVERLKFERWLHVKATMGRKV